MNTNVKNHGQAGCLMMTKVAMAQAESQKYSDVLDHQSRIISLLVTEAQQRARNLMQLTEKINRLAQKYAGEEAELRLFRYIENSCDEMYKFTEAAKKYYPNAKGFLNGTCQSTEAFNMIAEAVFGWDDQGRVVENRRCILCSEEEYNAFYEWLDKRSRIDAHLKKKIEDGVFSETDRNTQAVMFAMGGWNKKGVVMWNDGGEWREFESYAQAQKLTGYSMAKIRKAVENGTEYLGYHWETKEKYEARQKKGKFGAV